MRQRATFLVLMALLALTPCANSGGEEVGFAIAGRDRGQEGNFCYEVALVRNGKRIIGLILRVWNPSAVDSVAVSTFPDHPVSAEFFEDPAVGAIKTEIHELTASKDGPSGHAVWTPLILGPKVTRFYYVPFDLTSDAPGTKEGVQGTVLIWPTFLPGKDVLPRGYLPFERWLSPLRIKAVELNFQSQKAPESPPQEVLGRLYDSLLTLPSR